MREIGRLPLLCNIFNASDSDYFFQDLVTILDVMSVQNNLQLNTLTWTSLEVIHLNSISLAYFCDSTIKTPACHFHRAQHFS